MKKRLLMTVALLCASLPSPAQTSVTPILVPNQTFVDASGSPCVGCKLYTFLAGTTTAQPTYSDSAGTIQNTNPIVLNASGGGVSIWPATAVAYKYVLKNPIGTTIWTVDNVRGNSGSTPCGPSYAIQFADSGATELDCDPTINIDPFAHAIQVGGIIGATPHFNLQNLNTIPTTWTFDVTTPATALASLGGGALPSQAADTVLMNPTGSSAAPVGVALPNCPTGITYDTTSHTLGCYTAQIPLTRLTSQAADTVTMNAGASAASPTAVALPTGCTAGINYDNSTHTWSCTSSTSRICNSNGCYRTWADGTIEQWGVGPAFPGGATTASAAITFPTPFTTTANLSVQVWPDNCADSSCSAKVPVTITGNGTVSTSGLTVWATGVVPTGGGGTSLLTTIHPHWHAIGN